MDGIVFFFGERIKLANPFTVSDWLILSIKFYSSSARAKYLLKTYFSCLLKLWEFGIRGKYFSRLSGNFSGLIKEGSY
jgi:hypothetical protein